jgi:predicted sulfurtransferase
MEKYPNEDFEGKLYVFDGRVAMGFYTDDPKHKVIGVCVGCGGSSENIVDCREFGCNGQFILCVDCEKKQTEKRGHTYCVKNCNKVYKSPLGKFLGKVKKLF